jgi:hypothetical protein
VGLGVPNVEGNKRKGVAEMTQKEWTQMQIAICQKKVTYIDRKAAKKAQRYHQQRLGRKVKPYRCDVCRLWHLAQPKHKIRYQEAAEYFGGLRENLITAYRVGT